RQSYPPSSLSQSHRVHHFLHSFPTRRSSDLIGGSSSTDGGAGVLTALGARLLDESGNPVLPGGGALCSLASVDLTGMRELPASGDRKSTRLNSSHVKISYAVFCLKKKTIDKT